MESNENICFVCQCPDEEMNEVVEIAPQVFVCNNCCDLLVTTLEAGSDEHDNFFETCDISKEWFLQNFKPKDDVPGAEEEDQDVHLSLHSEDIELEDQPADEEGDGSIFEPNDNQDVNIMASPLEPNLVDNIRLEAQEISPCTAFISPEEGMKGQLAVSELLQEGESVEDEEVVAKQPRREGIQQPSKQPRPTEVIRVLEPKKEGNPMRSSQALKTNENPRSRPEPAKISGFSKEAYCKKHKEKLLDVVCMTDKTVICSSCALFDGRKNQVFREFGEVIKECKERAERLAECVQVVDEKEQYIFEGKLKQEMIASINKQKKEVSEKIIGIFKSISTELERKRIEMIREVDELFRSLNTKIGKEMDFPSNVRLALNSWKQESKSLLLRFTEIGERGVVFELLEDNSIGHVDTFESYDNLVEEMNDFEEEAAKNLGTMIESITVKKNETLFSNFLESIKLVHHTSGSLVSEEKTRLAKRESDDLLNEVDLSQNKTVDSFKEKNCKSPSELSQKNLKPLRIPETMPGKKIQGTRPQNQKSIYEPDVSKLNLKPQGAYDSNLQMPGFTQQSQINSGYFSNYQTVRPMGDHTQYALGEKVDPMQLAQPMNPLLNTMHHRYTASQNMGAMLNQTQKQQAYANQHMMSMEFIPQQSSLMMSMGGMPQGMMVKNPMPQLMGTNNLVHPINIPAFSKEKSETNNSKDGTKNSTTISEKRSPRDSQESRSELFEDCNIEFTEEAKKIMKRKLKSDELNDCKGFKNLKQNLDPADFENKNIGDKGVALIYDLLCDTSKVKSLKLMSANITDDGASILFKALSKNRSIDTLNLNKNKLTDACLPILLELAKVNKVLKKIYISQNNIKERSAREVIKKLKEMGVSLSV